MSSVPVEIANAVTVELNAHEPFEFTAKRAYRPAVKLEDLKTVQVTVVPKASASKRVSRMQSEVDVDVDVAIQQQVPIVNEQPDTDKLDALMDLVQDVADFLETIRPSGASFVEFENEPIFDPTHLNEQHVFTSLLTVKYRTRR